MTPFLEHHQGANHRPNAKEYPTGYDPATTNRKRGSCKEKSHENHREESSAVPPDRREEKFKENQAPEKCRAGEEHRLSVGKEKHGGQN
jgi:hypothetical protein